MGIVGTGEYAPFAASPAACEFGFGIAVHTHLQRYVVGVLLSAPRDDIDCPAESVASYKRCRCPLEHLDALDGRERDRDVHGIVPCLRVADTDAVEQDHHLIERAAAHAHVGLGATGTTRTDIQPGKRCQQVCNGCCRQGSDGFATDLSHQTIGLRMDLCLPRDDLHFLQAKLRHLIGDSRRISNRSERADDTCKRQDKYSKQSTIGAQQLTVNNHRTGKSKYVSE